MPTSSTSGAPLPANNVDVEVGRLQERVGSLSKDLTEGHARLDKGIDGVFAKLDRLGDDMRNLYVGKTEFDGLRKTVDNHSTVMSWAWKTVGTAILLGLLGLLMNKTGLHP